jgi:hypothetical protein
VTNTKLSPEKPARFTLERSVAALDAETRKQFDQVYEAILGLMTSGQRKS